MSVEVQILKAKIVIQDSREIQVVWMIGMQAAKTDKKIADQSQSLIEFSKKEACFKVEVDFIKTSYGSWQPEDNYIILKCGDINIGTYTFNLASYIGKVPDIQKALMAPENSTATGLVLKGNAEQYPGAFLEFKITVTPPAEEVKTSMTLRSGSVFSQETTPKQAKDVEKSAMIFKLIKLLEEEQASYTASEEAQKAAQVLIDLKEKCDLLQQLTAKVTSGNIATA